MTAKVAVLQVKPGIQRDGTRFMSASYVDGQWVRFQNGLPRKIGGYNSMFLNASGISRGMIMQSNNGSNYVISGYSNGLEQWVTANYAGVGTGPLEYTISSGFTANANNLWQFDIGYSSSGGGNLNLIAHPGQNLSDISSAVNTRPLFGSFSGTTLTPVGVFTAFASITSGSTTMTFPATNLGVGAGVSVSGSGIQSGTTVVSALITGGVYTATLSLPATSSSPSAALTGVAVTGTAGQFSCTATSNIAVGQAVVVAGTLSGSATGIAAGTYYVIATNTTSTFTLSATLSGSAITTTAGTTTGLTFNVYQVLSFDNNISVSGGVVMLYPYLFVYGNNGLIQNCAAGDFTNWTSSDANANNVSSTKVVKGLPVRGGTTVPSGLFWTLDSLIRVSYAPQTVGNLTYYWRYDLVTQQSSIMSSQCVIEYDGIYYWVGTDRFLMYNGAVQEVPNSQNQNWFFDNLNYQQRQKVWASKVPRWGEIWFFYPRGDATECTDAIIYNVREKTWYDAGQSLGAQRSAGAFSEVFRYPVWGGNTASGYEATGATVVSGGASYAVGDIVTVLGGSGAPASLKVTTVSGSAVTGLTVVAAGSYSAAPSGTYTTSARSPSTGTGLTVSLTTAQFYTLWQHEIGTDQIYTDQVTAINSYFETPALGVLGGLVGAVQQPGDNLWTRCERIEPDFVQSGTMSVTVTGKGYADDSDITSNPYNFDPTTLKVDMREQRREMRLRFTSNTTGGNYFMGKVLLSLDVGDSRSTGNP